MTIEQLQEFFFWCMLLNIGMYLFTAIASLAFRDSMMKIQMKLFGVSEETVRKAVYHYIAAYKLLITFFAVMPWIALLIINGR